MAVLAPVWGWWPVEASVFAAAIAGGLAAGLAIAGLMRRG